MQTLQQYKNYIIVISVLVLIRFILQPLWQQRQDNWLQLEFSFSARQKSLQLLEHAEQLQLLQQQMQQQYSDLEKKLGVANDLTQFKLTSQQQLEQLFTSHDLMITLTSWRDGLVEQGAQTAVLDLRFNGNLKDYLQLLQTLQKNTVLPSLVILEQQLDNSGQSLSTMGKTTGRISFRLAMAVEDK